MSAPPSSIVAHGVSARYPGSRRRALHSVEFAAGPGMHVLLGPTGAGKSTLLRVLATLLPPESGRVLVGGCDAARAPLAARRLLGYAPQEIGLPHQLTLREFLLELAALDGLDPGSRGAAAEAAAEAVHLAGVLDRRLGHCSGGMRRRAMLAQALLRQPSVLLADEPTAGLDPEEQVTVQELLRALARRAAVVVATHLTEDAAVLRGRITLLFHGAVLVTEDSGAFLARAAGRVWDVAAPPAVPPGALLLPVTAAGRARLLGDLPETLPATPLPPTLEAAYLLALQEARHTGAVR